jgi:hypothetical protein
MLLPGGIAINRTTTRFKAIIETIGVAQAGG